MRPVRTQPPPLIRRVSMSMLTLAASFWACSLAVFGLLLVSEGVADWISTVTGLHRVVWRSLGVSLFTGGQFVFMFMVADRIFPRAGRRLMVWCCELTMVAVGVSAFLVALIMAFVGEGASA